MIKDRLKIALWLSIGMFFVPTIVWAQVIITGTVSDSYGPVIGANIIEKGTTNGVISDINGDFKLQVSNTKKTIIKVSYVGYKDKEIPLNGKVKFHINLEEDSETLQEVTVVAYGIQKKETLTGAISSVKTDALLASPNASVANSLAGKITGLSSVQNSGQPGAEDPKIFVRGVGSLTEGGAAPLTLVDGVERNFYQMDPNEIESITVLKDASATAVFGVRGANGVILVTTRRGTDSRAKISLSSSVGISQIAQWVEMSDVYTYAQLYNEQERNDGREEIFKPYDLDRFEKGDNPIMYPNINWRDYMVKTASIQAQHNLNLSGGTDKIRYFVSVGFLYQDGLLKDFGTNDSYKYKRYNYRTNLDYSMTKSTTLKLGIDGIVGDRQEPTNTNIWKDLSISQPFSGPGLVNGKPMTSKEHYSSILYRNPFIITYGKGHSNNVANTMNLDLHLVQNLNFITKGLSVEVKGAYNTDYSVITIRRGNIETYTPYFESEINGSELNVGDSDFNYNIVHRISGINSKDSWEQNNNRGRNWYFETNARYNRKFNNHNMGVLSLYNQNKKYYGPCAKVRG
ncbi:SusC/RagA family TonB-linked outer membrane protein [Bacteroides neonati]|uniref:SusC/RagA family TonB-linked outer membrane protein n=1 Tax=Bacteroides neonati TaxID=1347393 RepID=UPI0004B8AC96|nr:SusC/RagA family TonB-linked outer membrane protein [Bacteroides neonati]